MLRLPEALLQAFYRQGRLLLDEIVRHGPQDPRLRSGLLGVTQPTYRRRLSER